MPFAGFCSKSAKSIFESSRAPSGSANKKFSSSAASTALNFFTAPAKRSWLSLSYSAMVKGAEDRNSISGTFFDAASVPSMKIFIFPFPTAAAICTLLPSRSALASIVSHSLPLNTANDTILRASKNFSSKAPGWRTMISSLRVHGARSAFFAPPSSYSARGKNPLGAISATTVKAFAGELKSPGKATAEAFSMTFLDGSS